ncbi:NAD+ synthase [Erwinia piriflorinigrans]|uniref:Glutamine-dependent NAD(+) synthetase n=1 Tax=Erwinia piriflorinigrans CFBP 5888 TaxID=1161919 RepID=V5ZCP2_9GAMM|nr:NAD+ synthase [Erwinia piriflorinigrans]CCG89143.1 NAD synthetase [Erwinia piriflorinigrans CFBP 5888]
MTDDLCFEFCVLNSRVGDVGGNSQRILHAWREAELRGVDLLFLPEMALSGYPAEDLVLRHAFMQQTERTVEHLVAVSATMHTALMLTTPWFYQGRLINGALLIERGEIVQVTAKYQLPTYGVFDELRWFASGNEPCPVAFRGQLLGVMICEDVWLPEVSQTLKQAGATILISLNASPWTQNKYGQRLQVLRQRAAETGLPVVYFNLLGGQDELVFDGGGCVVNAQGEVTERWPAWQETHYSLRLEVKTGQPVNGQPLRAEQIDSLGEIYTALMWGLRDYVRKNGFSQVLLGLSGGIDSALVAVLAADALGAQQVRAVMLPSRYSSQGSLDDARELAQRCAIGLSLLPIAGAHTALEQTLSDLLVDEPIKDLTGQNIQARSRGTLLMALSNQWQALLLSTGNKSEVAVGYCTLYGDMCGGFNPLKDVYKTQVYALCHWRNQHLPLSGRMQGLDVIPQTILTKAPSAELKPGQQDSDSLPPYEVLDALLHMLIEENLTDRDIAAKGFEPADIRRVAALLEGAEYKRRQAAPGTKISDMALSRERRYPITHGFSFTTDRGASV